MMGERTVMQEALFYEFSIERHVPADHLLRSIDRFVDLSDLRSHLKPFYSEIGRPSIDPELMIRMLRVQHRASRAGRSSAALDRPLRRPVGHPRRTCAPSTARSVGLRSIPELMIRMLIVGYCFGIRSERRLCEEVHLNLAYRWFL